MSDTNGGFLGGFQAGYDWVFGKTVVGAVADFGWSSLSVTATGTRGGVTGSGRSKLDYVGTIRGRVGYAMDRTLIYAHGGIAFGRTKQTLTVSGVGSFGGAKTKTGYTIGAGVEYAVNDTVSVQGEYSYTDLGTHTYLSGTVLGVTGVSVTEKFRFHTLKAVANYRF